MKAKIDIGIVTFNRKVYLEKALNAFILMNDECIGNIFVFDNGSTDDTSGLTVLNNTKVVYHRNNENIGSAGGFAACMNFLKSSDSDWIWLFNDDSYPNEDSIKLLKTAFEEQTLSKPGLIKVSREINGQSELLNWNGVGYPSFIPISNHFVESDLVTFDGALIAKEVIMTVGTCNPKFFMGTYEHDFCLRVKDKDFKIYTLPNGTIIDLKLGSTGGVPIWRTYYNTRNHLFLVTRRFYLEGIYRWALREAKFTIAIILYKDKKIKRLYVKSMAIFHGLIGKLGKNIDPMNTIWK